MYDARLPWARFQGISLANRGQGLVVIENGDATELATSLSRVRDTGGCKSQ